VRTLVLFEIVLFTLFFLNSSSNLYRGPHTHKDKRVTAQYVSQSDAALSRRA
jgi:hypothetical protein